MGLDQFDLTKVPAEKLIERGHEKEIQEMKNTKIISGKKGAQELPTVDVEKPAAINEFDVIKDKKK